MTRRIIKTRILKDDAGADIAGASGTITSEVLDIKRYNYTVETAGTSVASIDFQVSVTGNNFATPTGGLIASPTLPHIGDVCVYGAFCKIVFTTAVGITVNIMMEER